MIDHSFGPTGEFIFPVSLAMLSEAAKETEQNHLIIDQSAPVSYTHLDVYKRQGMRSPRQDHRAWGRMAEVQRPEHQSGDATVGLC